MRVKFLQSLAIGLYFICSSAFAQESQGLLELLTSVHSLQADFVQTILDNKGRVVEKSKGKMALERPGYFRWQVSQPISQLIIVNDTRIWIYDPDLQQVVIRSLAKAAGTTPAFLLTNTAQALKKDFVVQRIASPRFWEWYSLTPKNSDSMYSSIQLGFFKHEIKEMRMNDNLGHNTVIQFNHLRRNIKLSPALFKFRLPAHVDVIDETR